jgi:hypothetical protein
MTQLTVSARTDECPNHPIDIVSQIPNVLITNGLSAFMSLREEAKQAGIQDLSLDEINQEIDNARRLLDL